MPCKHGHSGLGLVFCILEAGATRKKFLQIQFEVDGFVKQISTEFVGGKYYLVFNMQTDAGEEINQKRFLFLENNLALKS